MDHSNQEILGITKLITEIDTKTRVINDIVFQTKLLSFNASVEAARAGEHGKGFAVVAEEVGNLAQMSGNASKEISHLLSTSTKTVNDIIQSTSQKLKLISSESSEKIVKGTQQASKCDSALGLILGKIHQTHGMLSEIAVAAKEQKLGISEIHKAINQIDKMTQQNSSASENCFTTSKELYGDTQATMNKIEELSFFIAGSMSAMTSKNDIKQTQTKQGELEKEVAPNHSHKEGTDDQKAA
jgi:methyl-accepting chemotaxis protein